MAFTPVKPDEVIETAIRLLEREHVLSRLVWNNPLGDFSGRKDDTVTVRLPGTTAARDRNFRSADPLVFDSIAERSFDVKIDKEIYNGQSVTQAELSLDIRDFGQNIVLPQVKSLTHKHENYIADEIEGAPYEEVLTVGAADEVYTKIVDANKFLNQNHIDRTGRIFLVGAGYEAELLKNKQFTDASQAGDDSALRDATLGRIYGNTIVTSSMIDEDSAYLFHRTAFIALQKLPAELPELINAGATSSDGALGLRWWRFSDGKTTQTYSAFNAYCGYKTILDKLPNRDGFIDPAGPDHFVRGVKLTLGS